MFFVDQNRSRYKVLPHDTMLQLTKATTFTFITKDRPSIPHHKFNFVGCDQLSSKIENNIVLSDKRKLLR